MSVEKHRFNEVSEILNPHHLSNAVLQRPVYLADLPVAKDKHYQQCSFCTRSIKTLVEIVDVAFLATTFSNKMLYLESPKIQLQL